MKSSQYLMRWASFLLSMPDSLHLLSIIVQVDVGKEGWYNAVLCCAPVRNCPHIILHYACSKPCTNQLEHISVRYPLPNKPHLNFVVNAIEVHLDLSVIHISTPIVYEFLYFLLDILSWLPFPETAGEVLEICFKYRFLLSTWLLPELCGPWLPVFQAVWVYRSSLGNTPSWCPWCLRSHQGIRARNYRGLCWTHDSWYQENTRKFQWMVPRGIRLVVVFLLGEYP